MKNKNHNSSFRDNAGFIFKKNKIVFRQINQIYKENYERLMDSGLYRELVDKNWLLPHEEVDSNDEVKEPQYYKTIKPQQLQLISYPYEWSFGMLKNAALLTLYIQKTALKYDMSLKDASVFNTQFVHYDPIFIDTLSFEKYMEGSPWIAYRQFCQHYLAPLALMAYTDLTLSKLLVTNLEGIPLVLAAKLLPIRARLNFGLILHLYIHSKNAGNNNQQINDSANTHLSKSKLLRIIDSLINTVNSLKFKTVATTWGQYYEINVGDRYLARKKEVVSEYLSKIDPIALVDYCSNDGYFSQVALPFTKGNVYSYDFDTVCVEQNFQRIRQQKLTRIIPLIIDATNPTPSIGWANKERTKIWKRTKADTFMALAIMHHLCISNYISFDMLAKFFYKNCTKLIIEFVPKGDDKVNLLLQNRIDIFDEYHEMGFEKVFEGYFDIIQKEVLAPTKRTLYLLTKKSN